MIGKALHTGLGVQGMKQISRLKKRQDQKVQKIMGSNGDSVILEERLKSGFCPPVQGFLEQTGGLLPLVTDRGRAPPARAFVERPPRSLSPVFEARNWRVYTPEHDPGSASGQGAETQYYGLLLRLVDYLPGGKERPLRKHGAV